MKILLSGGSGFIGKNLLNFLSQNNENIMVIGRNLNSIKIDKLNKLKLDLNNPDASYDEIIKYNPDVFVHLAWEGIPDYSEENCRKNYFNTVKLIRMLVNSTSCSKIISTGSCWEYNDGKIIGKCKESETINPSKAFSIYKKKSFSRSF
jgi:nucleoside-diphosphate-sugar epimerase